MWLDFLGGGEGIRLSGWGLGSSASISIEKSLDGLRLRTDGVGTTLTTSARWGNVVRVSAYLSEC